MNACLARSILALIATVGLVPQSLSFEAESRREGETCNTNSDCAGTLKCETGACRGVAGASQSAIDALEDSFQNDADVVRLTHLKYYSDLLAEYHNKTGSYPLQDKAADMPVYVFVATDTQRVKGAPSYKHAVVSVRDWVSDLEIRLGRPLDEYYDPQYFSDKYKPNFYIYMVYKDTFFFAVHLYQDYPFAKNVAEHYNKLEISNKPNARNNAVEPAGLFESGDFQDALAVSYKVDFFKEREAKYLHFTKQQK